MQITVETNKLSLWNVWYAMLDEHQTKQKLQKKENGRCLINIIEKGL